MCGAGAYCILRGAELHMFIIVTCLALWLLDQYLLATGGYLSVPPPREYTDEQRKRKCLREFAWWIYLFFSLGINSSIRFRHKDLMVIRLATIAYTFLLFTGLSLWWMLRESGYDHLGLAAAAFLITWFCCATIGITHLINLCMWTIQLEKERRERNAEENLISIQNSNNNDMKIYV